jgi:CRISPR-associated exonuclease Cas4
MSDSLKICDETEYLQIAGIQHFAFCRRQWALIHIEQQWEENFFTIDGEIKHETVNKGVRQEKFKNKRVLRSLHVISHELEIQGICDVVELREDPKGEYFSKYDNYYTVFPIEYKRGKEKRNQSDILQLTAQCLCLEEMMGVDIHQGAIFYFETRNRVNITFTSELRENVKHMISEMNQYYKRAYTPRPKKKPKCKGCSLREICLPKLSKVQSASHYIKEVVEE